MSTPRPTPTDDARSTATSTFVFADLAGYTALTEAHGDEHAADEAAAFVGAVRQLLTDYDAEEVKAIGDALLLRVAQPVDAVHLAARIIGDLCERDRSLGVRVGMHTGTAVRRGDDWFGSAVNVASRVADLACSGEVLMTAATREAVAGALLPGQLRARGAHELKNLRDPVSIFELAPEGEHRDPALPVDPVCRMVVDPSAAAQRATHDGITYYFCSEECAGAFRDGPEHYAAR
jgi:class 3 adenylate cyclase/YHS domain-containing protein